MTRTSPGDIAEMLKIDISTATRALSNIELGVASWIVVSGKICSGKDTVAPLVQRELGFDRVERVGYSDLLKHDLSLGVDAVMRYTRRSEQVRAVSFTTDRSEDAVEEFLEVLEPLVRAGDYNPMMRTDVNRDILIDLGGKWLRDPEQLSRKTAALVLGKLADGVSVYLTGGRFEPDVRIPQDAGATVIRLDVSPEVQAARLRKRDGLEVDPKVIDSISETALDNWEHFDVRILNDGTLEEGLNSVLDAMRVKGLAAKEAAR